MRFGGDENALTLTKLKPILFRCSAHPAEPSELRFSELGFIAPGIMGVGSWLIGGRLVGRWLLIVAPVSAFGLLVGWLLLVVCCRLVVGCRYCVRCWVGCWLVVVGRLLSIGGLS